MFVYILGALLLFISVMMILLILIQRGRGGGLAGAFGGMGGQSALGVRAGDVFTKITVVIAISWVILAGVLGISMRGAAKAESTGDNIEGAGAFAAEEDPTVGNEAGDEAPETKKAEEPTEAEGSTDATGEGVTPASENPAAEASTEAAPPETSEAKSEAETAAPPKPDEAKATEETPADDSK